MEKDLESKVSVYLLGFVALVFGVVALIYLKSILIPFVVALILAMLGRPLVHRFEKWHFPTVLASIFYILFLMVALFLGFLFMVSIVQGFVKKSADYQKQYVALYQNYSGQIKSTLSRFDSEKVNFSEILDSVFPEKPTIDLGFAHSEEEDPQSLLDSTELKLKQAEQQSIFPFFNWSWMVKPVMNVAFSFGNFFKSLVTIMLFLFFILLEWPFLREKLDHLSKREDPASPSILSVMIGVTRSLSKYFYIKIIVSLLTAFLVIGVGFFVSLDFLLMWGVLAFVLNFIPSIGSILFWFLVTLMSIIQYAPNQQIASIVMISLGVFAIEMIVGNIIDPLVSGDSLDLSPLIIVFGLMFWGFVWGIVGMFLSVPIMLFVRALCAYVPVLEPVALMMGAGRKASKSNKPLSSQKRNLFSSLNFSSIRDRLKQKKVLLKRTHFSKKNKKDKQ